MRIISTAMRKIVLTNPAKNEQVHPVPYALNQDGGISKKIENAELTQK